MRRRSSFSGCSGERYNKFPDDLRIFQAEYLSVSPQAVSSWERDVSAPDVGLLVPLANTIGVTLDALFDRSTSEESEIKEIRRTPCVLA